MTISTEIRTAGPYAGDGSSTGPFTFAFKVFATTDLTVLVYDATGASSAATGYVVTLNADQDTNPGGYVTLASPLASGSTLRIFSAVPYTQAVKISNEGGFSASVIAKVFDKLTALILQLKTDMSRTIVLPLGEFSTALGSKIGKEGSFLGINLAGNFDYLDGEGLPLSARPVAPEEFGAVGNGVTDDTAAFLSALATKKKVQCDGAKTYAVKDLTIAGNEWLDLNGATLVPYDTNTRWLVRLAGFNGPRLTGGTLSDTGYKTVKSSTTTASALAGATTITVADGTKFAADMLFAVKGTNRGEFVMRRVVSVADNVVTLTQGIPYAVPSGAVCYGTYGLIAAYGTNLTMYGWRIDNVNTAGGGVAIYEHGAGTSDISRGFISNVYSTSYMFAHEVIFNRVHDVERDVTQGWGSRTLTNTVTATGGQTTLSVTSTVGLPSIGNVFHSDQVELLVNGTSYTYTSGAPGAGQFTVSADGLTVTFPAVSGGETLKLNVYEWTWTQILFDPHGLTGVQGAHKWTQCTFVQNLSNAIFDNENNSAGLLHLTRCNFDAGAIFGTKIKNTNKFYATHLFSSFSPFPVIVELQAADRPILINGLYTALNTSGHFDTARVAGATAITIVSSGTSASLINNKPKVRITNWWGPDWTKVDTYGAIGTGDFTEDLFQTFGNVQLYNRTDPTVTLRRSNGTVAAPTATALNDTIAQVLAQAHDGTDFASVANLRMVADQAHTGSARGTRMELRVTANGATSPTQVGTLRIGADNNPRWEWGAKGAAPAILTCTGTPEGVVTAPVGSLALRIDGGAGTSLYVKQSGTGNTGWVGK